ncbi:MAG: hypothetical protein DHS80DRAFT_14802 [Piptocephalis tieghemiana]|nr:MAG: hypothetical protein DHS80DRAFT_14802 [Piptocephalis tieghemiana]
MEPSALNRSLPFILILLSTGLFVLLILFLLLFRNPISPPAHYVPFHASYKAHDLGLAKCASLHRFPLSLSDPPTVSSSSSSNQRSSNPRAVPGSPPLLLTGGILWDPEEGQKRADLLVQDGVIRSISCNFSSLPEGTRTIHIGGRFLTPGLVDMHSHIGVDSLPELSATDDTNEMTGPPVLPQVRTLDAFDPHDPALAHVLSGGLTTALVLPGSGDLIGGEAYAFKTRPVSNHSVEGMLVYAGSSQPRWRWMKMACGENPKGAFGQERGIFPSTRMGEAWSLRQAFSKARSLIRQQDAWCEAATNLQGPGERMDSDFPESLHLESLTALLRGHVRLNVHCYETHDLEMILRVLDEFNIPISSFHHALSAWKVPDLMLRANVTVATFTDLWGYKQEAMEASVHSPRTLLAHGVPVALKSDHPVLNSQFLLDEAAKARHYGLTEDQALQAITSIPASSMGLGDRLGRLLPGYDADLVIWDHHPLSLGTRPLQVIVDGQIQLDALDDLSIYPHPYQEGKGKEDEKERRKEGEEEEKGEKKNHGKDDKAHSEDITITNPSPSSFHAIEMNLGRIIQGQGSSWSASEEEKKGKELILVVENNRILCIGPDCDQAARQHPGDIYDMRKAWLIPGLVLTGVPLGLREIEQEDSTGDGEGSGDIPWEGGPTTPPITYAADGIGFGGPHLAAVSAAGITTVITPPLISEGMVSGVSVALNPRAPHGLDPQAFLQERLALHVTLGEAGKDAHTPSLSRQIALLRHLLIGHVRKEADEDVWASVAQGHTILAVHAHSERAISAILRLREEVRWAAHKAHYPGPGMQVTLIGGAEAHLMARELAQEKVPVILHPSRCQPLTWDMRRCLVGQPLTQYNALQTLERAGVHVAIGADDPGLARNLIWEAGWMLSGLREDGSPDAEADSRILTEESAIASVTWRVASALGLKVPGVGTLAEGSLARWVAYDGSPLQYGSRIMAMAGGGRGGVSCYPEQN